MSLSIPFSLKAYDGEEAATQPPDVEITCRFVVLYRVPSFDGITNDSLHAFARTSGVFSVWPYWRELVQSLSLRLSVPPIILPTYRA